MDFWKMGAWKIFLAGGPLMWPILFCSIVALALAIEKFLHLRRIWINSKVFMNSVFDKLRHDHVKEAIKECDATPAPLAVVVKAGIMAKDSSRDEIKEAMEDASLFEIPRLERNLSLLATIAHITPLLGLLGTVTGMVRCFQTIQIKATSVQAVSPGDLAGGIWEALLTTVAGLLVAIPVYVAYNFFVDRVNFVVIELERGATELVNFLTQASSKPLSRREQASSKGE